MVIDVRTPEDRQRELRNAALGQAKRQLERALDELAYLINATPTSERRNAIADINIHATVALTELGKLQYEEKL